MRYFLTGTLIVAMGIAINTAYNYLMIFPRFKCEVIGVQKEYYAGDKLSFAVKVKNGGHAEKCVLVESKLQVNSITVNFPQTLFIVPENSVKDSPYSYQIPKDMPPGKCRIDVRVKDKGVSSEKKLFERSVTFNLLKPKPIIIPEEDLPVSAELYLVSVPRNLHIGDTAKIAMVLRNTSLRRAGFDIKNTVINKSRSAAVKTYTTRMELQKGATRQAGFEFFISKDVDAGEYSVTAELYSPDAENAMLAVDDLVFTVHDQPPRISFKNTPITLGGSKETVYKVDVSDDKFVKSVTFFYTDMETGQQAKFPMSLASGTVSDGTWTFASEAMQNTGKYRFYIAAIDSFNQEARTPEQTVNVIRK